MKLVGFNIVIFFISMTSFFAFSIASIVSFYYFYFFLMVSILAIFLFSNVWFLIDRRLLFFYSSFLLFSVVGFLSYPVSMVLEGHVFDYDQLNIIGRLFNLFFLFLFFLLLNSYLKIDELKIPFVWYWYGLLLLMLTAIWQFFDVFLNLVDFPFETRSHFHSTYGSEFDISERLTGIAREPSYFTVFAIDFVILSLLFACGIKRIFIVGFGLFLIIFSLSPSGYITITGAFLGAYTLNQLKYFSFNFDFRAIVTLIGSAFFLLLAVILFSDTPYFEYFHNRISDPSVWESERVYMSYMPFVWAWDSHPLSFLFGHGIKSYSIIGTAYNVLSGDPVHDTSNNLYVDVFWESGLLGLMLLISFFLFVLIGIYKSKYSKFQSFIAFFLFFDLVFSGFFRADYASFRFFILLYLIYILISYDLRKLKGFYV